ncbi:MAG: primosomal protein N', partial [Dehalococcoidia bacterium]|nr:primosomal protein N' [Dehalococcoidia bacterium]
QGIVVDGPLDTPGFDPSQVRPIVQPELPEVILSPEQLRLAKWLSEYYFSPLWDCLRQFLPPGVARISEKMLIRKDRSEHTDQAISVPQKKLGLLPSTDQEKILDSLSNVDLISERAAYANLKNSMSKNKFDAAVKSLERLDLLDITYSLPKPRISSRVEQTIRLRINPESDSVSRRHFYGRHRTREAEIIRQLIRSRGDTSYDSLTKDGPGKKIIDRLLSDGILTITNGHIFNNFDNDENMKYIQEKTFTNIDKSAWMILQVLLQKVESQENPEISRTEITNLMGRSDITTSIMRRLAEQGLVDYSKILRQRDPLKDYQILQASPRKLTLDQQAAVNQISRTFDEEHGEEILLKGVAGSGKTEVYIDCIRDLIARQKTAILLVPEIALTPQMIQRFSEQFPGKVGVMHSALSQGEIYDEWQAIRRGDYQIVIGSRSCIFVPQPNLGLIIIDEFHDTAFKQSTPSPRYDARLLARMMSKVLGCTVVYGSATPNLEKYFDSQQKQILRIDMDQKINMVRQEDYELVPWPTADKNQIEVIDIRYQRNLISPQLSSAISEALDHGEQVLLFVNRRGYAPYLVCDNGCTPKCNRCDLVMSLHNHPSPARLRCHLCGLTRIFDGKCQTDGCEKILRPVGVGTERVVEEIESLFPTAKVGRWDSDSIKGKNGHLGIMRKMQNQEIDLVVGTQMITKGLDLPLVTLVGVVVADGLSTEGDFREHEKMFALLSQVSGRAGRSELSGRVIFQTFNPSHSVIQAAVTQDVDSFLESELAWRREYGYPPYRRVIRLGIRHHNEEYVDEESSRLAHNLSVVSLAYPNSDVRGPFVPRIARARGLFRRAVLIFSPSPEVILRDYGDLPSGWVIDVDPVDFD